MNRTEVQNNISLAVLRANAMAYNPTAESCRPILPATPQKHVTTVPNGADMRQVERLSAIFDDRSEKQQLFDDWPKPTTSEQERLRAVYAGGSQ